MLNSVASPKTSDQKRYAKLLLLRELHKAENRRFHSYRSDPVGFSADILGARLWSVQQRILSALWTHRRVVVPSCYASGKTYTAGSAIVTWVATDPGAIAISTAPTWRQVEGQLWGEVRKAHSKAGLPGKMSPRAPEWYIGPSNFAKGFSTDEPTRFQGWHAPRVLVVLDEAAGVSAEIWEAMEGQMASEDTAVLAIGNPAESAGPFFDAASSASWHCIPISAFDTPNFAGTTLDAFLADPEGEAARCEIVNPDLVTPAWAAHILTEKGADSFAWMTKVLGSFPDAGQKIMVPLSWFDAAGSRSLEASSPVILGLDIARFGTDDSAVCVRRGPVVVHLERIHGADGVAVAGWAGRIAKEHGAIRIHGDSAGLGGPVLDILRAQGHTVVDINAGSKARHPEEYCRLRDELWWGYRDRFRTGDISLAISGAEVRNLRAQSTALRYGYDLAGRIKVESKDEAAKRGIPSPDLADAACLAFDPGGSATAFLAALAPPCHGCGHPNKPDATMCERCAKTL